MRKLLKREKDLKILELGVKIGGGKGGGNVIWGWGDLVGRPELLKGKTRGLVPQNL